MAKFYLDNNDVNQRISNKNTSVYGANATESVIIDSGVTGTIVDQNVESATFATGSTLDYKYSQSGNKLKVYAADGTTLVADVALNSAGTPLTFSNGTVTAAYSTTGVINLGGKAVTSTATVIDTAATVDATKTSGGTGGTTSTVTGLPFTLTTSSEGDNLLGGASDDTFNAVTLGRLQSADILDGGAGNDVLNAKLNSTTNTQDAVITAIETLNFTLANTAGIAGSNITGATKVNVSGGYTLTYTAQDTENFSVSDDDTGLTVTRSKADTSADAITVTLGSGKLGTVTIGDKQTTDFETITLTAAGASQVTLVEADSGANTESFADTGDKIVIDGSGDLVLSIDDALLGSNNTSASTAAASIDASGYTGYLTVALGATIGDYVDVSKFVGVDAIKLGTNDSGAGTDITVLKQVVSGTEVIINGTVDANNTFTATPYSSTSTTDNLTVTLNHATSGTAVSLTTVTLDGFETATINSTGTNTASTTVKNSIATLAGTTTDKNLTISGDKYLTVGAQVDKTWTNITVTNTAGVDLTMEAGSDLKFTGGAGNDRLEIDVLSDITKDDTLNGGAGTGDVLAISDTMGNDFSTAQLAQISGFEVLEYESTQNLGSAGGITVDLTKLTGVNTLKVDTGTVTVASSNTLTVKALDGLTLKTGAVSGGAAYFDVQIANALAGGTNHTVNAVFANATSSGYANAGFQIKGVESLNISVAGDESASGDVITLSNVNGTALQSIKVTSTNTTANTVSDSLTVTDVESTIINNFDASTFTGALDITGLSDNYMTAGAVIKGGTGVNNIIAGAGGDTITTGKGADVVYGGQGYDSITTGAGIDLVLAGTGQDSTPEADSFTLGGTWDTSDTIAVTIFGKTFTQTYSSSISGTTLALKAAIDADADISKLVTVSLATNNTIVTVTSKVDGNFTDFTWAAVDASGTSQSNTNGTNVDGTNSSDVDTVDIGTGADFVHTAGGADVVQLGAADAAADTIYILSTTEGDDVISGFEAGSGNDVIKFAGNLFENGTESATLQSITKTGTTAGNYVFWEITTVASAGGVDTAEEVATFLSGATLTSIASGDKVVLALNDGADTYLWHYAEGDANVTLDADELTLVGVLKGVNDIANGDLAYLA